MLTSLAHPFGLTSIVALLVALAEVATVDEVTELVSGWLAELAICDRAERV